MSTVRDIWQNIVMQKRHAHQRAELRKRLPALSNCSHDNFLSLYRFFSRSPEHFFSAEAYTNFYSFLESQIHQRRLLLQQYLDENEWRLNQALLLLKEVNGYPWHDEHENFNEYEELRFLDRHVHPAYLRLIEGVFYNFTHIAAHFSRLDRGKGTDGLDLFNVVEELKQTSLSKLVSIYRHVVRNGIAHGGVVFRQLEIEYQDKKGNNEILTAPEITRLCDDLLDTCNGLALAIAVFYLVHLSGHHKVPEQLLIEELQAETDSPWWRVEGSVATQIPTGPQLLIYAKPNTRDVPKVHYYTFMTAALAELFAPGYARYFFSLRSPKALPGFAGFSGPRLREIRLRGPQSFEDYRNALEDGLLFYIPKPRLPRFLGKIDTMYRAASINMPLTLEEIRQQQNRPEIIVRSASIHRNGAWSILNGAVVVVAPSGKLDKNIIRNGRRKIIIKALSHARHKAHLLKSARWLALGWARISVFQKDYRKHHLSSFGRGSDLVCTIQVSRLSRIRAPDILGSTIEQYGRYRIAWNQAWIDQNPDDKAEGIG